MKRRLLLATSRATEVQLKQLARFTEVHQLTSILENELDAVLPTFELVLLHAWPSIINEERVRKMKRLRFVQTVFAGVNHIPFHLLSSNVIVSSGAGAYSVEVGEYALAHVMAAAKNVVSFDSALRSGTWVEKPPIEIGKEVIVLQGKTVGILGYGGIGRFVAKAARSLGMDVMAFARKKAKQKGVRMLYGQKGLDVLLSSCDVAVSALPLNKKTDRLIGARELSIMKENAILVNIGRAEIIDQTSLYEHLSNHPNFRYATDVWWLKNGKESLTPDHPFFRLPNFIGTPHASGPSATVGGRPMEMAVQNTLRYLKGLKPRNVVEKSDYL